MKRTNIFKLVVNKNVIWRNLANKTWVTIILVVLYNRDVAEQEIHEAYVKAIPSLQIVPSF